jgi:hypothetical protein
MKPILRLLASLLPAAAPSLLAAELNITSPLDYQVVQRSSREAGTMRIAGTIDGAPAGDISIEAQLYVGVDNKPPGWRKLDTHVAGGSFAAAMGAPKGGWHLLEVRAVAGGKVIAESAVEHVGIGELFVVAGQSNSANYGEEKQTTETERVVSFDGARWRLANDPQRGASGGGGSFMPPLGDALVKEYDVPVGFIPCGIGATSVREWLPKGATFPNPPTLESRVEKLPSGEWASKGDAFATLVGRMKQCGERGFRAVLWHQGESDANQRDPSRTLSGTLYREYLERVIRESRREIGWDAPWFVAQVSYHGPDDEGSPEIRAAQASLWQDGVALEGPDTDALTGDFRERQGRGVHFSGAGLREHAARWAEKILPWLEQQLRTTP